jgi:2,3-bisphosphoglycerate-independent phosphoglycerate mutase
MYTEFFLKSIQPAATKIVLLIIDGLGGLPREPGGKTELETASTPNLDALAARSALGLSQPAGPGITVGSGPGHLAIFGYDPLEYEIGRGALEALGVDLELGPDDLAARGNFCTVDENGLVLDRRAGRIPNDQSRELVELLNKNIQLEGVECFLETVKEHRLAFVMRGPGLGDALSDSDPLKNGVPTLPIRALNPDSEKSARLLNEYIAAAQKLLAGKQPANMLTLRGFNRLPVLPSYAERFGLHAAAIAVNGMYRGVARLAGMDILHVDGVTPADEFATLEKHWPDFDFFYLHVKQTDICGEMGDFEGKVRVIESVDALIPRLLALNPDVVIVTGDHSTPAVMKAHSWHPVPLLLYSIFVREDGLAGFGERACARGSLGVLPAKIVMRLALANAGRVAKYGA